MELFGEVGIIIGQALSIVAVILGVISFQMRSAKGILFFQILTALVFSAHYFLIGAMTAMGLNFVAAIKCVCYYIRNKRGGKGLFIPVFFTVLVVVTSLLTWDAWYSVFIMTGLVVNSIGFSLADPQKIRKLVFIKAPLCLIYNICVLSVGGIIYEGSTFVSAVIGAWKHSKRPVEEKK